jgi:hypothetical protein
LEFSEAPKGETLRRETKQKRKTIHPAGVCPPYFKANPFIENNVDFVNL